MHHKLNCECGHVSWGNASLNFPKTIKKNSNMTTLNKQHMTHYKYPRKNPKILSVKERLQRFIAEMCKLAAKQQTKKAQRHEWRNSTRELQRQSELAHLVCLWGLWWSVYWLLNFRCHVSNSILEYNVQIRLWLALSGWAVLAWELKTSEGQQWEWSFRSQGSL